MIDHKLTEPEGMKGFDYEGYQFNAAMSQGDEWVFIREHE